MSSRAKSRAHRKLGTCCTVLANTGKIEWAGPHVSYERLGERVRERERERERLERERERERETRERERD